MESAHFSSGRPQQAGIRNAGAALRDDPIASRERFCVAQTVVPILWVHGLSMDSDGRSLCGRCADFRRRLAWPWDVGEWVGHGESHQGPR
eukprot:7180561-Prymnesium_polylepis.1